MTKPVLVAPDSFKGTYSAREVAAAIAEGLREAGRETMKLPVADGGEGTLEAFATAVPATAFAASICAMELPTSTRR